MKKSFNFESLVSLCGQTHEAMQGQAARSVNIGLVVRNWLFGWYIVEYQQNGADRAVYGAELLKKLSAQLTLLLGRGFSVDSLELMRRFFAAYNSKITEPGLSETVSRIFPSTKSEAMSRKTGNAPKLEDT